MIEEFQNLSPEDLLYCYNEALGRQAIDDHINFRQYRPEPKQRLFHSTGLDAKERAFFAGNRCGKSYCVSAEGSMHLTGVYPENSFDSEGNPWSWNGFIYDRPINMWVAGETSSETSQSLKSYYVGDEDAGIKGFIHSSLILDYKPLKNLYYIRHSSGGVSRLRFKSYEQKAKKWQAETLDLIHLDEEPPSDIYSEAFTRTISTSADHHGMVMCSLTPLQGVTHFMLSYMERDILDDQGKKTAAKQVAPGESLNSRVYIFASHEESPHITPEESERILSRYSPHEREARTKGIPSMGSGLIYPFMDSDLLVSPFSIPDYWPRCFGMDFGWHNTAAVFLTRDPDNGVTYLYGEYLAGQLTPQSHAVHLLKMGADWMPGAYDGAGESATQDDGGNLVNLYGNAGIRNWVPADKRSVGLGLNTVYQLMETGQLKIFSTCVKTMTELRMYTRDKEGKVKKGNDHLMDAMRYAVVSGLPIAQVKSSAMNKYRIPTQGSLGGSWMRV